MFKFIAKIISLFLLALSVSLDSGGNLAGEGAHTFYFYSKSSSAKMITLSYEQTKDFIYFKNQLKGESVVFYDCKKAKDLLAELNAKLVFKEKGEDFDCEYYYSPQISNAIYLNGKRINLHFCYSKDRVVVGSPLVFGSF